MQAAQVRWMARPRQRMPRRTLRSILALLVGPVAMGCGSAAPIDVGTDLSQEVSAVLDPEAVPGEEENEPNLLEPLIDPAASAACSTGFEACGGLLAGRWIVEDTCNSETRNPKALQIWGQTFRNLDTMACFDAVQSVTTRWSGMLMFDQGLAIDRRMRSDTIEMNLTRTCLNATFHSNIREDRMSAICAGLTNDMTNCSSVGGVCVCSNRRERDIDTSGTYGVLGKSVAIGAEDDTVDFYDYCVQKDGQGDRLLWREPSYARHVVLRREGAATAVVDPEFPH